MKVKVGLKIYGVVMGHSPYGIIVQPDGTEELVYAKASKHFDVGDDIEIEFKSFSVGCYWEATPPYWVE